MGSAKREELFKKARGTVERLLKVRLRSEAEILEKLAAKKLPASVIRQTIEHFKAPGLIDDAAFARAWSESRLKRPFGISRIRVELKKKGVEKAVIEAALQDATQQYDEGAVVTKLARDRVSKYKGTDPEKIKQRVFGYLQRRGFGMNSIMKAIKTL